MSLNPPPPSNSTGGQPGAGGRAWFEVSAGIWTQQTVQAGSPSLPDVQHVTKTIPPPPKRTPSTHKAPPGAEAAAAPPGEQQAPAVVGGHAVPSEEPQPQEAVGTDGVPMPPPCVLTYQRLEEIAVGNTNNEYRHINISMKYFRDTTQSLGNGTWDNSKVQAKDLS